MHCEQTLNDRGETHINICSRLYILLPFCMLLLSSSRKIHVMKFRIIIFLAQRFGTNVLMMVIFNGFSAVWLPD